MLFTHPFIHLFICSQLALDIEKAAVNLVILSDTPELTVQEVMHKYGLIATACLFCNAPMHEVFQCVVNVTTIHHNHNHNQSNNRSNYNNNHNIARNINMMSPDVSPQSNIDRGQGEGQGQRRDNETSQQEDKSQWIAWIRQLEVEVQGHGQGPGQGHGQGHGQGQGSGLRLGRFYCILHIYSSCCFPCTITP